MPGRHISNTLATLPGRVQRDRRNDTLATHQQHISNTLATLPGRAQRDRRNYTLAEDLKSQFSLVKQQFSNSLVFFFVGSSAQRHPDVSTLLFLPHTNSAPCYICNINSRQILKSHCPGSFSTYKVSPLLYLLHTKSAPCYIYYIQCQRPGIFAT